MKIDPIAFGWSDIPVRLHLNLSWQEAEELRDAINRAYPVPRGGVVAELADGITECLRFRAAAGPQQP